MCPEGQQQPHDHGRGAQCCRRGRQVRPEQPAYHARPGDAADAEQPVEPRHHRSPGRRFYDHRLHVNRDADRAEPGAEGEQRGGELGRARRRGKERQRRGHNQAGGPDHAAAAELRREGAR